MLNMHALDNHNTATQKSTHVQSHDIDIDLPVQTLLCTGVHGNSCRCVYDLRCIKYLKQCQ